MLMKKYLIEVRYWILLISLVWLSILMVIYFYKEILLFSMLYSTTFSYFIFTDAREILEVYIKVFQVISFHIWFLFGVHHLFQFTGPAFYKKEFKWFQLVIRLIFSTFLLSSTLSVYVLIPLMWDFFLSFQNAVVIQSFNLFFEANFKKYVFLSISFYYFWLFWLQLLVFSLFLLKKFVFSLNIIRKLWKFYYYCFIIFSSFISSPELLSQLALSLLIIICYECSIVFFLWKVCLDRFN